jgi:hypothetical protein
MSNESKLFWIKDDPGKSKTMMMIGLINELSGNGRIERSSQSDRHTQKMVASEPKLVSFFFCQSIRPELNNATAILRGLIYLLVRQKEELMRHVRKKYEATGSKMFDGPETIYALKRLLSDIAHDSELPKTLLLVDALDECNTGLPNLLDFINSIPQVSKVKWLVTSRNLPNIERGLKGGSTAIKASYRHAKAEGELTRKQARAKISLKLNHSHIFYAVCTYIDSKVDHLSQQKDYDEELRKTIIKHLRFKTKNTFL